MSLHSARWFGRGVNRSFPSSLGPLYQNEVKREGEKGRKSLRKEPLFLYSAHQLPYSSDDGNCQYMTNHEYIGGDSQPGPKWITLFTGTSKKKRFCCSGSRSKHDKQWSVSWEYTFKRKPLVLPHQTQWLQKTEQSPAWEGNNLWKENYEYFLKSSAQQLDSVNRPKLQLSLYKPLRSSFKAVYDFALKARQGPVA